MSDLQLTRLHRRVLAAVNGVTYADDLAAALKPTDPIDVQRAAAELVESGQLTREWGSWSGEATYRRASGRRTRVRA